MDEEKIFWALVAVVVCGMFLLFTVGSIVQPASAAQYPQGGNAAASQAGATQFAGGNTQASQGVVANAPAPSNGAGAQAPSSGSVQEVTLTVQGGNYYPYPIQAKVGQAVRLTADLSSVRGCAGTIVIPEFGVRKTFTQGDNSVEFTPTKSGTFAFTCGMGMYRGQIVVANADGTVADFTGSAPVARTGGTCGAGGGGCGCGG